MESFRQTFVSPITYRLSLFALCLESREDLYPRKGTYLYYEGRVKYESLLLD